MKVIVTHNIETDLDITNEPPISNLPVVQIWDMPSYILVKLTHTWATPLEGLQDSLMPIEPAITTYHIKVQQDKGHTMWKSVWRKQFPMTAAYAFTDYHYQGQTLPYVIVDIASQPIGTLSLFNLYIALSRSSGRVSITV